MTTPTRFCLSLLLTIGLISTATSADRVALVIGVNQYENLPANAQLRVAVSDAELMASSLKALDPAFEVTLLTDVEQDTADEKFEEFLKQAAGAECALLYFAGHGIEYHGANYLLVKDTAISEISPDVELMKRRLGREALSLQAMVDSLDLTGAQVKLVVLDCCRDNPLTATVPGGSRSVVGGRSGLAQVAAPSGTLISYSADAGQKANDGLFTTILADNLKKPGLTAVQVFATTRDQVREISTEWAEEDAKKGLDPDSRRVRHEPAEYTKLNLAGTNFTFTRGVPVAVEAEESGSKMSESEIEKRALEMAEKLVAEAMRNQSAPEGPGNISGSLVMSKTPGASVTAGKITTTSPMAQGRGEALLFAMESYHPLTPLYGIVAESEKLQGELEKRGWNVTVVSNAKRETILETLSALKSRIGPAESVLFHFSGHGFRKDGTDYLIPVDVDMELVQKKTGENEITKQSLTLKKVIDSLGFTDLEAEILFSCSPGQSALSDPSFTGSFIEALNLVEGDELLSLLEVTRKKMADSGIELEEQTPEFIHRGNSSLNPNRGRKLTMIIDIARDES